MTPQQLETLAAQTNALRAVREVPGTTHARALLAHYYGQLLHVKSNCSNVSDTHALYITLMVHLYRALNPRAVIRATACGLPDALNKVGKYLQGVGVIG